MRTERRRRPLALRALLSGLPLVLAFTVNAPARAADKEPVLTIKGDLRDEVRDNVRVLVGLDDAACQPGPGQKALILRQVRNRSEEAMQALGYYQPDIVPQWRDATGDACFSVTLTITPGPRTKVETLSITFNGEAQQDPAFQNAIDKASLSPGDPLRHDRYEALKRRLQQLLIDRGYAEGSLSTHRLEVDRARHRARVVMVVDSGPRYSVGEIIINEVPLDPRLVNAYLRFASGEPFNNERLLATQQAYMGTSYFSAARLERSKVNADSKTIDVGINLTMRNRWALLTGVGVSTDTGPRLRLGIENRRINSAGHRARAETELSDLRQGVGANYQIPLRDPNTERLDLHTRYLNEITDTRESETISTGVDYIRELPSKWVVTTSLEYLQENFDVADQADHIELIMPGIQISRVHSDDPIYPRWGWRLGVKVRGAHESLASSSSFVQADSWAKLVVPLGKGRLLTRAEVGYTEIDNVRNLPASLRFFAGGDSSVRGFAYESLGPTNDDDEVIGGRHLLVTSVEYDRPISRQWSLAVFSDAGNAFNDFNDYDVERSAGFGVRWRSPLGPIRLDLARGLSGGDTWRLHLSMGPDL
ncbi:autotransporter assembly complex protein TamA [Alloalcanivorax xenomutans]|uniref:autotransporter assembly complex protein TamA n=1 Tax=Alloalcanivorax xenomutans TaxID=1094342 RepID=UPI00047C7137